MLPDDPIVLRPTEWEIASGTILGGTVSRHRPSEADPLDALLGAITPSLMISPCVVSFSGGRDSSIILAAATHAARAAGVPDPLPVTLRFPRDSYSIEDDWQERVIEHLGLTEWRVLSFDSELELTGPIAAKVLRKHGLLWPANAYVHEPIFEIATGGVVLTGADGDGLLGSWRWAKLADVMAGRRKRELRHSKTLARAVSPTRFKAWWDMRDPTSLPWLKEPHRSLRAREIALDQAGEPSDWRKRISWWAGRRYLEMMRSSLEAVATSHGVRVVHPFLDPGFLGAVASDGGRWGAGGRLTMNRRYFGSLLPDAVLGRTTKVVLTTALWGPRTRQIMRGWDGRDWTAQEWLDADGLRGEWAKDFPDFRTAILLHSLRSSWMS